MSNATPATDPRQQTLPLDQPLPAALPTIIDEILSATPAQQQTGLSKRGQYDLLKTQIAPGCTDEELALFMHIARSRGFDVFARHLYARKQREYDRKKDEYVEKMVIITSIDALRLKAARTKEHTRTSEAEFTIDPKLIGPLNPAGIEKCTIKVYRNGQEFPATVYWSEYAQTYKRNGSEFLVPIWQKMPHNQCEKCSESKALRRAFPEEIGDLYTEDEMHVDVVAPPVTGTHTGPSAPPMPNASGSPVTPAASAAPTPNTPTVTRPAAIPVTDAWIAKSIEAETLLKSCTHKGDLVVAFKKLGKILPRASAPEELRQKIGQLYHDLEASLPAAPTAGGTS